MMLTRILFCTTLILTGRSQTTTIPSLGFFNSTINGGSFLTVAPNTSPLGLGEPLNVILSALSDPFVLTSAGFLDYFLSIGFTGECLGQHAGSKQTANLGDNQGQVNETSELRFDYEDPSLGTCTETIKGGNHFRYWIQTTSNAYFLAVAYEMNLTEGHNIILPDGYASGRDWLVGNATMPGGTQSPITNQTYSSTATLLSGYLPANSSVGINHGIYYDGKIAVLTAQRTGVIIGVTQSSSVQLTTNSWSYTLPATYVTLASSRL